MQPLTDMQSSLWRDSRKCSLKERSDETVPEKETAQGTGALLRMHVKLALRALQTLGRNSSNIQVSWIYHGQRHLFLRYKGKILEHSICELESYFDGRLRITTEH